ncbi:MAG: phenylalanine--tRNA ligase subunit alpha [Wenzhouxiangellaceae bacterium]
MATGDVQQMLQDALQQISACDDLRALEELRVAFLGRKGSLTLLLRSLGDVPADQRRAAGQAINQAKQQVESALQQRREALAADALQQQLLDERVDVTLPGRRGAQGVPHLVTRTMDRMVDIFARLGFAVATGPEIESDEYNFEALNFPPHHPARAMHDTFYFGDGRLLRTHTSPVQVRVMKQQPPPVRVVAPGRVYRSDSDQTHTPMFNQLEGLLVDEGVSFADLKGILQTFVNQFFERDIEIRLRPSYFPFTEPSAEVDIRWEKAGSEPGWLEVLGCGMVHPNVLEGCGIDAERYTGYAFGMGVERLAMLRYGVTDLRQFFENDVRFLAQFA